MSQKVFDPLSECIKRGYLVSVATARSGRIVFCDSEIPGDKSILLEGGIFYNGGTIYYETVNAFAIPGTGADFEGSFGKQRTNDIFGDEGIAEKVNLQVALRPSVSSGWLRVTISLLDNEIVMVSPFDKLRTEP